MDIIQKSWIVPIPGTTSLDRLGENISSANVTLTKDELQHIDKELGKITIIGDRYDESEKKKTGL